MALTSERRNEPLGVKCKRTSPSCRKCANWKPGRDGWKCHEHYLDSDPESVLDLESGYCGGFRYRTVQAPDSFWKEQDALQRQHDLRRR